MGRKPGRKPTASSTIPLTCSKTELANIIGIAVRSVTDWDQKGVFTRAQGRGRYMLIASVNGYTSALREAAAARATSTGVSLTDERAMTEKVVREIKERELSKLKGETLLLAEVSESWSLFAGAVRAAMMSVPGKARSSIPHLTAHDADILKHICRDILLDLGEEVEASVIQGEPAVLTREK